MAVLENFPWDVSKKWIIKNFTGTKSTYHNQHSKRTYDSINFSISLKRKSTFYVLNLLVPCYFISIIASLCFIIPPQGGDRVSLLLTTFLSIVVFVLIVSGIMPEENDSVPLFSQFLLTVMVVNMLQLIYCSFVFGLTNVDHMCSGPPRCLVNLAKNMTSCMTYCQQQSDSNASKMQHVLSTDELSSHCEYREAHLQQWVEGNSKAGSNDQIHVELNNPKENSEVETGISAAVKNIDDQIAGDIQDKHDMQTNGGRKFSKNKHEVQSEVDNSKIDFLEKRKAIHKQNIKDWRLLFKTFDFLFFVLNVLGLTGYFLGLIVIYN